MAFFWALNGKEFNSSSGSSSPSRRVSRISPFPQVIAVALQSFLSFYLLNDVARRTSSVPARLRA